MKTAKISIGADISGFKKSIDNIKQSLGDLSKINLDKNLSSSAKNTLLDSLTRQADVVKGRIKELTAQLEDMNTKGVLDSNKIAPVLKNISALNSQLKEIQATQRQINATGVAPKIAKFFGINKLPTTGSGGGSEGGGMDLMGMVGMLGGPIGKAVGVALGGLGVGKIVSAQFATRMAMAQQNMPIRALTTDGETIRSGITAMSQFGFTGEQRRSRALDIAGQAGGVSSSQLERLVDTSEKFERQYGISGGQFAESVGGIRRAGGSDPEKAISRSIGLAVAAGLQGSQISDFLAQSTSYLASMAEGVNLDQSSLDGFASSLSTLPFFRSDPARAFGAIRGLNSAFQSDDPFMKAQATRAITRGLPGGAFTSPAATEIRRSMGLFGFGGNKDDNQLVERLRNTGGGELADTLAVGGKQILKNTFEDIRKSGQGMSVSNQAYQFMNRTGTMNRGGLELFQQMREGKDITQEMIDKATLSDTERLGKIMQSNDATMLSLNSAMSSLKESIANLSTNAVIPLTGTIVDLIKTMNPNYGQPVAANPASDFGRLANSETAGVTDMAKWAVGTLSGPQGYSAMRPFMATGMEDAKTSYAASIPKIELPTGFDDAGLRAALQENTRATQANTMSNAGSKIAPVNFDSKPQIVPIPIPTIDTRIPIGASTTSPSQAVQGR